MAYTYKEEFIRFMVDNGVLRFGEYNVMMMHGHMYSAKASLTFAASEAAKRGADLLLFGHTHKQTDIYLPAGSELDGIILEKPLRLFNPGALKDGSFGTLTLRGGVPLTSFGQL